MEIYIESIKFDLMPLGCGNGDMSFLKGKTIVEYIILLNAGRNQLRGMLTINYEDSFNESGIKEKIRDSLKNMG